MSECLSCGPPICFPHSWNYRYEPLRLAATPLLENLFVWDAVWVLGFLKVCQKSVRCN
jgi:hypothetical protein